jgi:hypothetical protein
LHCFCCYVPPATHVTCTVCCLIITLIQPSQVACALLNKRGQMAHRKHFKTENSNISKPLSCKGLGCVQHMQDNGV